MTSTTSRDLSALRDAMAGAVLEPADAGYDEARKVWNADIDSRPAALARCTSAQDLPALGDAVVPARPGLHRGG